jgi:ribosomal protein S18 acetylase RimI-like enzyme
MSEDGLLDDVVTYLEMTERPTSPAPPAPPLKLALMRAENCTVGFYRFLYAEIGEAWVWHERRLLDDATLEVLIRRPTTEIFVLYVAGVPAGYFELDRAEPDNVELAYFGLAGAFIGRGLGLFLLRAAVDAAWAGPTKRLWVHTCTFDHPRAIGLYQKAGFRVYDRRETRFRDPRLTGVLPRTVQHPKLPPLG